MIDDPNFQPSKPYWRCQSCGHADETAPMPADREAYYRDPYPKTCPKCRSEDMAPEGF